MSDSSLPRPVRSLPLQSVMKPVRKYHDPSRSGQAAASRIRGVLLCAAALGGLWWVLNPGDPASWIVGIPTILLGSAVSLATPSVAAARVSPPGAVRFIFYFMYQTVLGSIDVAVRALHPRTRIAAGLLEFPVGLPGGLPRIVFANCITLLPGTLTARIEGDRLLIHALSADRAAIWQQLQQLERRVGDLFALPVAVAQVPR